MQVETPHLVGLTFLRRQVTTVINELEDDRPTFVTNAGRPVAVLLSWDGWQHLVTQAKT